MSAAGFAEARRDLSDELKRLLVEFFTGLGSWRDIDVDVFVEQAVPLVAGAQEALAGLVAARMAEQAEEELGGVFAPPSLGRMSSLRKGVTPGEVYRRPFATVYSALAEDVPLSRAVELGATRLAEIAEFDLQQTYAEASKAAMSSLSVEPTGWRRVLMGEEDCALCVIASTQRYTIEFLNPIHPACDCEVRAIFGRDRHVIDEETLEMAHKAAKALTGKNDRGGRRPDYRDIMISSVKEHGEVGPVLVRPRDNFTGPIAL